MAATGDELFTLYQLKSAVNKLDNLDASGGGSIGAGDVGTTELANYSVTNMQEELVFKLRRLALELEEQQLSTSMVQKQIKKEIY